MVNLVASGGAMTVRKDYPRRIRVIDHQAIPMSDGTMLAARIWLPEDAGTFVTNVAFDGNWLYITEASQGVIWRVQTNNEGLLLYHQRN